MKLEQVEKIFTNPVLDENGLRFCSELRKCLLPPHPPEACLESEDQFSIAVLCQYSATPFPGHQSAFIKKENGPMPILVRETEAQKDKTLLSPCRLDLETRSMQTIKNDCCLIQRKVWSLNQVVTRDAGRSFGFGFGACVVSSVVNLSCWLGKPHSRELSGGQCPITHTICHMYVLPGEGYGKTALDFIECLSGPLHPFSITRNSLLQEQHSHPWPTAVFCVPGSVGHLPACSTSSNIAL